MLNKFVDMLVQFPYRYTLKESGVADKDVEIRLAPGQIYDEGTRDKAEFFNEIQKNCLYTVKGTRKMEGLDEIYDVTVPGLETFGIFDIKLLLDVDADSTQSGTKIRVLGEKYTLTTSSGNILAAALKVRNNYIVTLNVAKKTASIVNGSNDPLIDNYCPYWIGDILQTTATYDPATRWPGTKWELMEGFLRGGKSTDVPLTKGGKDKIKLSIDQMPTHGHSATVALEAAPGHTHNIGVSIHNGGEHAHNANHGHSAYQDGHNHNRGSMEITGTLNMIYGEVSSSGAFSMAVAQQGGYASQGNSHSPKRAVFTASSSWTGTTSWVQPAVYVNANNFNTSSGGTHNHGVNTSCSEAGGHGHKTTVTIGENGKGADIDILPGYTTVRMWRRTQ